MEFNTFLIALRQCTLKKDEMEMGASFAAGTNPESLSGKGVSIFSSCCYSLFQIHDGKHHPEHVTIHSITLKGKGEEQKRLQTRKAFSCKRALPDSPPLYCWLFASVSCNGCDW